MKNKPLFLIVGSLLLLVGIFIMGSRIYKKEQTQRLEFMAKEDFKTFVPDYAVRKGNPDAKVFVTEFMDPECESCREFHPHLEALLDQYKDKILLVLRYAPFHGNSVFVVKILEAARRQGKYWETLALPFQHQPEWGSHHAPRPELIWTYLPQIGLDVDKIKSDMEDPVIAQLIEAEIKAVQALQIRGTPTFFVNGKEVMEFGPQYLRAAIEEALKEN